VNMKVSGAGLDLPDPNSHEMNASINRAGMTSHSPVGAVDAY